MTFFMLVPVQRIISFTQCYLPPLFNQVPKKTCCCTRFSLVLISEKFRVKKHHISTESRKILQCIQLGGGRSSDVIHIQQQETSILSYCWLAEQNKDTLPCQFKFMLSPIWSLGIIAPIFTGEVPS